MSPPLEEQQIGAVTVLYGERRGRYPHGNTLIVRGRDQSIAIDPSLVRADRLHSAGNSKVDGVAGDPRRSSAELGKLGIDLIVIRSVEAIQKATIRR